MTLENPSARQGNRCGHDPENPRLSPPSPIRVGPGAPPRILSLAAEKAKEWFYRPEACPPLQTSFKRRTRSERREACQALLEFLLSRLDLATLRLGRPTLNFGFIDLDMKTIAAGSGLGRRRCERAVAQLKRAGFMEVAQPRSRTAEGGYSGLKAIRVLTARLFEWLGLGAMLARERFRAAKAFKSKIARFGLGLGDLLRRAVRPARPPLAVNRGPTDIRSLLGISLSNSPVAGFRSSDDRRRPEERSPGRNLSGGQDK